MKSMNFYILFSWSKILVWILRYDLTQHHNFNTTTHGQCEAIIE